MEFVRSGGKTQDLTPLLPHTLERKVSTHERHIAELVDSMAQLLAAPPPPPKRSIGFITPEDKPGKPSSSKVKTMGTVQRKRTYRSPTQRLKEEATRTPRL